MKPWLGALPFALIAFVAGVLAWLPDSGGAIRGLQRVAGGAGIDVKPTRDNGPVPPIQTSIDYSVDFSRASSATCSSESLGRPSSILTRSSISCRVAP